MNTVRKVGPFGRGVVRVLVRDSAGYLHSFLRKQDGLESPPQDWVDTVVMTNAVRTPPHGLDTLYVEEDMPGGRELVQEMLARMAMKLAENPTVTRLQAIAWLSNELGATFNADKLIDKLTARAQSAGITTWDGFKAFVVERCRR